MADVSTTPRPTVFPLPDLGGPDDPVSVQQSDAVVPERSPAELEAIRVAATNELTRRLRDAISGIIKHAPSNAHTTLARFLCFVTPNGRIDISDLPYTVKQHPLDPERCAVYNSQWSVCYFHVGNAILALRQCKPTIPPTLEKRIELLEDIARCGIVPFVVLGDEKRGYYLQRP